MILSNTNLRKEIITKGCLGFIIILILWAFISSIGIIKPLFLPSPIQVIKSLINLFLEKNLIIDTFVSIYNIFAGVILASVISIPLGILMGSIKIIEEISRPIVAFLRYTPASAFIPLSILWFGIGDIQKFFIIFICVAPYLTFLVFDAVANTKKELIEAGLTLGARKSDVYTSIIIPSSMPAIWDALRLIVSTAWSFIIVVEIVAANSGLGHVIIQSQRFLQTSEVIAIIILIGVIGLIIDYLFKVTYNKFFPWMEKAG